MKRLRGDGSQRLKRGPASSSRQSNELLKYAADSKQVTRENASLYLKAVKDALKDDTRKLDEFMEILKLYKCQRIDTAGVVARVKDLFEGLPQLISGFNTFLSKEHEVTLPLEEAPSPIPKEQPVDIDQTLNYVKKIKTRLQHDEQKYEAFMEILNTEQGGPFHVDRGFQTEVQELDNRGLKVQNQQHKKIYNKRGKEDESELQKACNAEKESAIYYDKRVTHQRKFTSHVDKLIAKQSQTGEGAKPQKGISILEKVKFELGCGESFREILKFMTLYSDEIINIFTLQTLIEGVLGKHQEILEEIFQFLSWCENNREGSEVDERGEEAVVSEMENVRDKDGHKDGERRRDHEIQKQRESGRERKKAKSRERNKHRDKGIRNDRMTPDHPKDGANHMISLSPPKESYMNNSLSQLHVSNCESCTPSYRLLPKNYLEPLCSQHTELGVAVLNNSLVSIQSDREDCTFKHTKRNRHKEIISHCEDDRFELDMVLEHLAATISRVGEMINTISMTTKTKAHLSLDEYLSAINLRCIKSIYGEHGLDILDLLRKFPALALPIVNARLKQKYKDNLRYKEAMNKIWCDVYSKYYHISLQD